MRTPKFTPRRKDEIFDTKHNQPEGIDHLSENDLESKNQPLHLQEKSTAICRSESASDAALRMRKSRQRRREGVRVLRVEVGIDTVEALLELDYLCVEDIQDFSAVAEALSNFIESTTDAVACNGITLNDW
jgi:hypothetical protein